MLSHASLSIAGAKVLLYNISSKCFCHFFRFIFYFSWLSDRYKCTFFLCSFGLTQKNQICFTPSPLGRSLFLLLFVLPFYFSSFPLIFLPLILNFQPSILNWPKAGVFLSFLAGFSPIYAGFFLFSAYLFKWNKRESISILTGFNFDSRLSYPVFFLIYLNIAIANFFYTLHTRSHFINNQSLSVKGVKSKSHKNNSGALRALKFLYKYSAKGFGNVRASSGHSFTQAQHLMQRTGSLIISPFCMEIAPTGQISTQCPHRLQREASTSGADGAAAFFSL